MSLRTRSRWRSRWHPGSGISRCTSSYFQVSSLGCRDLGLEEKWVHGDPGDRRGVTCTENGRGARAARASRRDAWCDVSRHYTCLYDLVHATKSPAGANCCHAKHKVGLSPRVSANPERVLPAFHTRLSVPFVSLSACRWGLKLKPTRAGKEKKKYSNLKLVNG